MVDIFISYSRKDQEYVDWIKPILKRLKLEDGLNYFQDIENISPGEDFSDSISASINNATIIICFLSNNFFASTFIQEHELPSIEACFNKGSKILILLIENVYIKPDSFFNRIQRVDFEQKTLKELKEKNSQSLFIFHLEKTLREEFKKFPHKQTNLIKIRYNLVVVGKSGVGKSELINYLFGDNVVNSGIGKPVTSLGFHRVDFNISGVPACIYDSAGLEVGSYKEWKKTLEEELTKRGPTEPIQKWFHTVLYCVQATGSRIENYELEIIDRFLKDKYKVIIVITKSFIAQNKIDELAKSIKSNVSIPINCIYVNSQDEEIGDRVIKKNGKSQLNKEIQISLIESLTDRIPARCIGFMSKSIEEQCEEQIKYINDNISSIPRNILADNVKLKLNKITKEVKSSDGLFNRIISRETKNTLSVYSEIAGIMDKSIFFDDKDFVSVSTENAELKKIESFGSRFDRIANDISNDFDITDKYGDFVQVVTIILTLPLVLIGSLFQSVTEHLSDLNTWRDNAILQINSFKDNLIKDLWKNEEDISKLYAERIRSLDSLP